MPAGEYSSSEGSRSSRSHRRRKNRSRSSSSDTSSSESGSSRSQKRRRHRSRSSSRQRGSRGDRRRRDERRRNPRRRSRSRSRSVERRFKKSARSSSSRTPSPPPKQAKVKRNFKQERYDTKNDEIRQKFQSTDETSVSDQIRRANELEALESSSFSVQSFTSSRSDKPLQTASGVGFGTEATFPTVTVNTETDLPPFQSQNGAQVQPDKESICHPNLFLNQDAKMQRWVEKLYTLRQNALKGRPLSS